MLDSLVQLVVMPLYDKVGHKTSLSRSLEQLSTASMASFNADYPDAPGIPYQSFAGRSNLALGGPDCDALLAPPFVSSFHATVDPVNPLLGVSGLILNGTDLAHLRVNDGLVPANSARWGTFRGCVPADHLDEIGQLLGRGPGPRQRLELPRLLHRPGEVDPRPGLVSASRRAASPFSSDALGWSR